MAQALLEAAVAYATQQGATLVEAYPVDKPARSDDEYMWFGAKSMYDKAGFEEVARRKPQRPIVRLKPIESPMSKARRPPGCAYRKVATAHVVRRRSRPCVIRCQDPAIRMPCDKFTKRTCRATQKKGMESGRLASLEPQAQKRFRAGGSGKFGRGD